MSDHERAVRSEVLEIRSEFVEQFVNQRINHRNGDVTTEQVDDWENEALRKFHNRYPALAVVVQS